MAEGILYNIVENILKNLGSRALDEIASAWRFKGHLAKLRNTVSTIQNVLLDAEERQLQSHTIQGWLERLKDVVYVADDLFDEFAIMASQKETLSGKVKTFFSESNQIAVAFSISKKIKKIREELDDIVKDSNEFGFVVRSIEDRGVVLRRSNETSSLVDVEQVVGREDDKKAILAMLLEPHTAQCPRVSVVPIVGIGGMGKTTLAQLVYNDENVKKNFELKLWVCVSDDFDVKEIVKKILMSVTKSEPQKLEMDQLQIQLREQIGGKKYILVLDDVWNEIREEWLKLSAYLNIGRDGSRILVTTRSRKVAKIMGTVPPYALGGLSDEESWNLFRKMAFEPKQEHYNPELEKLGKEIVKQCANVPLAIRTLGSLLYGEDERKWLHLKERSPLEVSDDENCIMAILKLSYLSLWSPLKNCFAYCALFPKDHELCKETLINLWMAEGFLIPRYKNQSLEDVGEEYFLTLFQRCFFQDVIKDELGNITGCKMHDLMHDLAKEVSGVESKVANFGELDFDKNIHHLSFDYNFTYSWEIPPSMMNLKLLRTLLLLKQIKDGSIFSTSTCHKFFSTFRCLRVLNLFNLRIRALPSSIGDLIHLRYINLSKTHIEELPDSITKLQRLQTLDMRACMRLKRLPEDIGKLTTLRCLYLGMHMTQIPSGIGVLTSLCKLPLFPLSNTPSTSAKSKASTAQLRDLKRLNDLRGSLEIRVKREWLEDPGYDAKEATISNKSGLMELSIHWERNLWFEKDKRRYEYDEAFLEGLKPHSNLKKLELNGYRGEKFPSWAIMNNLCTTLPNLVEIVVKYEGEGVCKQLPTFSQLPFLKRLTLRGLQRGEYMESAALDVLSSTKEVIFFPSLQVLVLACMYNLKSWWKEAEEVVNENQKILHIRSTIFQHISRRSFSNLSELYILQCPNLKSIPHCPNVEHLILVNVNEDLSVLKKLASSAISANHASMSSESSSKLKTLRIGNVEDLISLPKEIVSHLSSLEIYEPKLISTHKLRELFKNLHSLSRLKFHGCYSSSLESIGEGLGYLTALETLVIENCKYLDLSRHEGIEDGMPWKALNNLQYLTLAFCSEPVALPSGFQHLRNLRCMEMRHLKELELLPEWICNMTSLECLKLGCCEKLRSLPEGLSNLTRLSQLEIVACHNLRKRCTAPTGEDWPKIQHIPTVILREFYGD